MRGGSATRTTARETQRGRVEASFVRLHLFSKKTKRRTIPPEYLGHSKAYASWPPLRSSLIWFKVHMEDGQEGIVGAEADEMIPTVNERQPSFGQ